MELMGEKVFSGSDLEGLERRFRATFLNSLNGVKTAILVGSIDAHQCCNLAVFNSITHIGANPPLIGLLFRPEGEAERHTLANIRQTGNCTLNMMHYTEHQKVHHTSAKFPEGVSEFSACGFKEEWREGVAAPFVSNAQVKMGWRLKEELLIQSNGTILLVGELFYLALEDRWLSSDGLFDHAAAGTLLSCGLDAYVKSQDLVRLTYARPDTLPQYQ